MAQKNKSVVAVIIVAVCVAVVVGVNYLQGQKTVQSAQGRAKGNPDSNIKVVEFIDFQCPACASGAKFLNKYIKDNPDQIHLEMKYFPLKGHVHGMLSARFTECAARQGKFWEMHDKLIDNQSDWKKLINAYPSFEVMAQQINLDMTKLNTCLDDTRVDEVINKHKEEGKQKGVRSTPTYFVNGQIVVGPGNLKKELEKLSKGASEN